jgi:glycine/D-amino acid oxidase-like deaminating enzyme
MTTTVDVAVIGGGIIGVSTAYYLARAGLTVTLIERRHLASGGSGASTAIVRTHYDNAPETRLAVASLPVWANWADRVGVGNPCFEQTGVLWLVGQLDAERLRNNVTMHRAIGAKAQAIPPAEAGQIEPALDMDGVAVAAWEPDSGYVGPVAATHSFAEAARQRGVNLELDTTVVDITVTSGRVVGVRTDRGFCNAGVVVNAAGPWAGRVGQMVAVDLPISVERRQVASFSQPPELRRQHVGVIDQVNGTYFRPEWGLSTLAGLDRVGGEAELDDFSPAVGAEFPDTIRRLLAARMPAMAHAVYRGGWGGLIDLTPDGKAILGAAGPEGFYLACGFSGTGFKVAPAVGICLAELISGGQAKAVDLSPFRLSRFAEGQPIHGEWEYEGGASAPAKRTAR